MTPEEALELFAVVPVGILSVTREGVIRGGNFAAARLLDHPLKDLRDRSFFDDLAAKSERERIQALFREERFDDRLLGLRGSDGRVRMLRASARPLPDGSLALVIRDTTLDRARERARLIEEKMQALGRMASGVAHEFGNVMATLSGYAQLADRDPSMREELVKAVLASSDRVRGVTDSLRAFERAPSGESEPFDLGDVAVKVLAALRPEIERAGVKVERRLEARADAFGQRAAVEEAVLAVVRNAIEAAGREGTVLLEHEVGEGTCALSVSDTGPGVPEELRDRVFDPFFTTKGSLGGGMASASGGLGLGLAIAWNRIREQEGDIEIDSAPTGGARFRIVLPGRRSPRRDAVAPPPIASSTRRMPRRRSKRTILVVDPEPGTRQLLEAVLKADHWVRCVGTGQEALEAYEVPRAFDYVVLDLSLGGTPSGADVFRALKARDPRAKIILLARSGSTEDMARDCVVQAYAALRKPEGLKDVRDLLA